MLAELPKTRTAAPLVYSRCSEDVSAPFARISKAFHEMFADMESQLNNGEKVVTKFNGRFKPVCDCIPMWDFGPCPWISQESPVEDKLLLKNFRSLKDTIGPSVKVIESAAQKGAPGEEGSKLTSLSKAALELELKVAASKKIYGACFVVSTYLRHASSPELRERLDGALKHIESSYAVKELDLPDKLRQMVGKVEKKTVSGTAAGPSQTSASDPKAPSAPPTASASAQEQPKKRLRL